jgi:polygalacturonase
MSGWPNPAVRHRSQRVGFFIAIAMSLATLSAAFAADLTVNVKDSGAIGDGVADDTAPLQGALNGGQRTVLIPAGTYKISATLKVDSQTTIQADPQAVIRLADHAGNDVGLFVLANRDFTAGNRDITVEGGIWDGNNENNARGSNEQIPCSTGVAINFINVHQLTLRNLTVRNPDSYAIRACHLTDFVIENIGFDFSVVRPNQDGVHLNGFCERGVIRNLRALSPYATNDDMVALNADDGPGELYVTQQGMVNGPIRDITVERLRAESAFTFVRLLSHRELIENITISDVAGGCRFYAINMDRWRFPEGGGKIRNVTLRNLAVRKMPDDFSRQAKASQRPLIHIQTDVHGFRIENFRRTATDDVPAPTLVLDNGQHNQLSLGGLTPAQETELRKLSPTVTPAMFSTAPAAKTVANRVLQMDARGKVILPAGGFVLLKLDSPNPADTPTAPPKASLSKPKP